jgi:hypothetical protein
MILQQLGATALGPAQVNVPRFAITAQVFDDDGKLVADFTGANVVNFPADIGKLTAAQRNAFLRQIGTHLVYALANRASDV